MDGCRYMLWVTMVAHVYTQLFAQNWLLDVKSKQF